MGKDVFISYSSVDINIVNEICLYLENYGVTCFIAHRDIPKGVEWADIIPNAIRECKCFLTVHSFNFNASEHVARELTIADNAKKTMIIFRIDNTEFKNSKEYYLANKNWIDSTENSSYELLLKTIRDKLSLPEAEIKDPSRKRSYNGIWIGVIFLAFFAAGFIHSRIHSYNNENVIKTSVQRVQLGKNPDILVYMFSDECIAYNTKTDSIIRCSIQVGSNSLLALDPDNLSMESKIGYVGLGVLITKIFKVKVSGKNAVYYYIAAGAAIIAGYGLGYYIHEKFFPVENSTIMKDFLSEKYNWRTINNKVILRNQILIY